MKPDILTPFLDDADVILYAGDCVEVMKRMPGSSVDAIVTDPPYGLEFMGKGWDGFGTPLGFQTWTEAWAVEAFRILKPGGHLLAFAGTRTYHRGVVSVEDAGFEIRDCVAWLYGSGFPKSLDVSKAIDRAAGAEREVTGPNAWAARGGLFQANTYGTPSRPDATSPATDAARQWSGWGTALKPAHEPICMARKPLIGTVAANVLAHGTGAINVDGCRVGTDDPTSRTFKPAVYESPSGYRTVRTQETTTGGSPLGRWPANFIHDGSEEATAGLGEAARFFYTPKAGREDREEGCDDVGRNIHPTVKPTDLMRYLCRLVTPPGGTVLDPFTGSGSTGRGAVLEGFDFIGCELSPEYAEIARARIRSVAMPLFPVEVE
jgi:site-specific DNA-methyltransferase (adenine-specific)